MTCDSWFWVELLIERLWPEPEMGNVYIGPLNSVPTEAAISLARLDASPDPRYPGLKNALAHAQVVELEPGDAV